MPAMKLGSVVLVAAVAAAAVACKKVPDAKAPAAAPMPADIVAVFTLPSLDSNLPRLEAYVDKASPGKGAELRVEVETELHSDAADWKRPMYVVLVAPAPGADEPEVLAVVAVRNEAAIAKTMDPGKTFRQANGWAVIGKAAVVDHALAWATTSLVSTPAPTRLTAVAYPDAIRARWRAEIEKELSKGPPSPATSAISDLVLGLIDQTERIEGYADIEGDEGVFDITLTPRAGTTLAAVLAAQKPSTFEFLEQLPISSVSGTMAGHVELGPLSKPLHDLLSGLIASELADAPPGVTPALGALIDMLFTVSTGEYAGVVAIGSNSAVNTFGVTDTARIAKTFDGLGQAVQAIPMPPGVSIVVEQLATYDGVSITSAKLVTGGIPALTGTWAAWDGRFGVVFTDPDGLVMRSAIDASRGKSSRPKAMARLIADARKRGDFLIDTIDMAEGDQAPLAFGLGVRGGALHVWGRFPVEQIQLIVSQFGDDDDDD
jgi:hypothetical protein